tara:strand:- start:302 stop:730 length:429 start_codon:yes stop_codon:yes gene_type:complete
VATRRSHNYLRERYNCETKEILQLFALRGYTLRETADALDMKYSTLKTQAWNLGIQFNNGKDAIDRTHRVTYQGVDYTTKELSDMSGIPRKTLMDRLRYGWTAEQAMTTPVRMGNWTHREGTDREPTGTDITSIWLRKKWKL